MNRTRSDKLIIKTELETDPQGIGYAGLADEQVAEKMSAEGRTVDRESIGNGHITGAITKEDYDKLTPAQKDYLNFVTKPETVQLTAAVRTDLGNLFPAVAASRANLGQLFKRPGSRAEELGLKGRVDPSDVADAKREGR